MRSIFGIAPLVIGSLVGCLAAPLAQAATPLAAAFAQAWARQPAALAEGERQRAVSAQSAAADRWTPAPGSLELGLRSDRFNRNQGASEVDVGVAIPLWLPGERSGAQALAAAAEGALAGRQAALRLQLAQALVLMACALGNAERGTKMRAPRNNSALSRSPMPSAEATTAPECSLDWRMGSSAVPLKVRAPFSLGCKYHCLLPNTACGSLLWVSTLNQPCTPQALVIRPTSTASAGREEGCRWSSMDMAKKLKPAKEAERQSKNKNGLRQQKTDETRLGRSRTLRQWRLQSSWWPA